MKLKLAVFLTAFVLSVAPVFAADASAPQASGKTDSHQIVISEYMFAPAVLNIATGTKVTWINHDEVPHTIVDSSAGKIFRSGALDTNDVYSYTFTKPGTYRYFCTLHPQMVGTVVVAAAE